MANYTELLTPTNCQLIIIDHQPQMAFGVQSIDRQTLKNDVLALALKVIGKGVWSAGEGAESLALPGHPPDITRGSLIYAR